MQHTNPSTLRGYSRRLTILLIAALLGVGIWSALLQGSQTLTLSTLRAGDSASAAEWLRLREYRESTRVSTMDDP